MGCWVEGLIASPPCPTFSAAGKGAGRHLVDVLVRCVLAMAAGTDMRAEARRECFEILRPVAWKAEKAAAEMRSREPERAKADAVARRDADMSVLVVEPMRWAFALQPEWIALEQVPEVLSLWSVMAQALDALGYSAWAGVLEAERYGVPQTRERAILMARRGQHVVHPPRPTHQRYVPGEPQRHDVTLDGEVLPWVSMAEALGWTGAGQVEHTQRNGNGPRAGEYGERDFAEPAFTVATNADRWKVKGLRMGSRENATERAVDEPAPTVMFGNRANRTEWVVEPRRGGDRIDESAPVNAPSPTITSRCDRWQVRPSHYDGRGQRDGTTGKPSRRRAVDEPAPTIAGESRNDGWAYDRPATTIAGDPRVHPPGHKLNGDDVRSGRDDYQGRAGKNAVRVSIVEAAVLQSFRPDYPWQGNKSETFRQVGNAMPPLLARAVLGELVDAAAPEAAA